MIKKIRNKITEKYAVQFNGSNHAECEQFIGKENYDNTLNYPNVITLEGYKEVGKGYWIIKGLEGEFYPCKPDIFEQSYEFINEKQLS
jgi:hypothetical protein